jgi:1,2-diacylglycerol 3-alpha-glucosyltransferase
MNYSVAQFNDTFPPLMDGVAIVVWNYARWLNKTFGKCYSIVSYSPGPRECLIEKEEMPVIRYFSVPLPFRFPYRIGLPWLDGALLKKLTELKLNLVHSHNPFSSGLIARKYARKNAIPVVATFHSKFREFVDGLFHSKKITESVINKIVDYYHSVDSVWVSNKITGETLKTYGYRGEPEIIPHGTDFKPPKDIKVAYETGNKLLGIAASDVVFLYVGFLSREKNLDFLMRALSLVKKMRKHFKMFFIGEGYAQAELQRLAWNLNLSNEIRFLGVIRDRERLQHCYARANLLLFPSVNDTYSLVIREAAVFRVPSVILENTNTAEGINDSYNGFITERFVDAYAEKIAFLIDHPQQTERVGLAAFQTLYVPWENVIEKVKKKYINIITNYSV